ncbi:SusC/RagA family TonB-linked outer membrane protein [Olivibacter sp. SDN3]|uniref:SusC/RagA family TonB-linked outer membrane protein n=1 Tax=Olivibacter sp. SDN3 TaxID=2764720 RepID=UPI0016512714|nr:SusC/RagA family TonB-linked outer membrane protein [Olivibacter sp. SDN3]QNL50303.1 SusC/RagA family TonB-linked outer membrane protein [Olivibacter sp. SDN3]
MNLTLIRGLLCPKGELSASGDRLSAKSRFKKSSTNKRNIINLHTIVRPHFLGRTTVCRDQRHKIIANHTLKVANRYPYKTGIKMGLNGVVLRAPKPYAFYLITLKILFCVCLAHARQSSFPEAATGVALRQYVLKGKVLSVVNNDPLTGSTISIVGNNISTKTEPNGNFIIKTALAKGTLRISHMGYRSKSLLFSISEDDEYIVTLSPEENVLDEIQVIGYGETSKRFNTGSVSSISAKEIDQQPVTNVLSALSGRMPGVFVQTTNGLPGGNINIQIRGKGSIAAGTSPLYIIDGVPFNSSVGNLTSISVLSTSAINGLASPLNAINPNDIESITILKDADATAIYGSRGSNGVVLITTKKGKQGNTKIAIDISNALNQVANLPKLLNMEEYRTIREEAFTNDGRSPSSDPNSADYAPELTVWNDTLNRNWPEFLLGGTGSITNLSARVSGGNAQTQFTVNGNYRAESTYLPGDNKYARGSLATNIQHQSANQKFQVNLSNFFTLDNNRLVNPSSNTYFNLMLPPNYPIYNEDGSFNWHSSNVVAEMNAYSKSKNDNFLTNIQLKYNLDEAINIAVSAGYNRINFVQRQVFPGIALYPGSINYTNFGNNGNNSLIIEPQINYTKRFGSSNLTLMLGGTYQNNNSSGEFIRANNFSTASLMENLASATDYLLSNSFSQYRYASVFGRATFSLKEKYVVNGAIRRDASSRFGPNNKIGTFGAVGIAWLFSEERFLKSSGILSHGKLRASFGTTGNDQISDYQYLSTYGNSSYQYEGVAALAPLRIANSNFRWEKTKKIEMAVEVGLFKDRLLINANRYMNTSKSQLVAYTIPSMTGFTSYQANLPAKVSNSGWEVEVSANIIATDRFRWTSTFNITIPKTVLKEFDNLENSSYARTLVIDEDISRIYGYKFTGLDEKGKPLFETISGELTSLPSSATDAFFTIGKQTPDYYGGIGSNLSFGKWTVDIFGQFAKQMAMGGLNYTPGSFYNSFSTVLERWTPENTVTDMPAASTSNNSRFRQSSGNFFDASYFRLKTIGCSYDFGRIFFNKIDNLTIYAQAQNLFTLWDKRSALLDPESGALTTSANNLPPTRTLLLGIRASF